MAGSLIPQICCLERQQLRAYLIVSLAGLRVKQGVGIHWEVPLAQAHLARHLKVNGVHAVAVAKEVGVGVILVVEGKVHAQSGINGPILVLPHAVFAIRSEEHTSELSHSQQYLVCRLLLEKIFF